MVEANPNYYSITPADVRYDNDLTPNAKHLYGEITALANKDGLCWATNDYFAKLYNTSEKTITRWIKNLSDKNYINTEIKVFRYDDGTVKKIRYISIVKNVPDHTDKNVLDHTDKNVLDHTDKNVPYNNTSNINNINNKRNYNKENVSDELKRIVEEVINYMNEIGGTSFLSTSKKTITLISARLKDGFSEEDLKDVVFYKCRTWKENPMEFSNGRKSDYYYKPTTLFSSENFEGYLQEYRNQLNK